MPVATAGPAADVMAGTCVEVAMCMWLRALVADICKERDVEIQFSTACAS